MGEVDTGDEDDGVGEDDYGDVAVQYHAHVVKRNGHAFTSGTISQCCPRS